MKKILSILAILISLSSPTLAQQTASYGTLVTSLDTTSTGAVTGTAYAVPLTYAALIQWTVVADGSALSVALKCSVDNTTYFTVDTITTAAGGTKQFGFTACRFIRIDAVSRTGGTATVGTIVTSRGFITGSGTGSLSGLVLSPGPLTITQGTLTSDTQAITSTATWNNAAVAFTHWKVNITDTASNSASLLFDFQKNGSSLLNLRKDGTLFLTTSSLNVLGAGVSIVGNAGFTFTSRSIITSPADGQILLSNNAITDFTRLQFGGTTSSFPSLRRQGTGLLVRLADDSGYASLVASSFTSNNGTVITDTADGVLRVTNGAGSDFNRLMFGGSTSSFPAIKRNGTGFDFRLADDSAYTSIRPSLVSLAGSGGVLYLNRGSDILLVSNTAPTVTSAGTSPSIPSSNGTVTFRVNVGTGGTATTIVLALPAASNGWNCMGENITATAANRANQRVVFQSSTTTAATLQNQTVSTGAALAFTASDIVSAICFAY